VPVHTMATVFHDARKQVESVLTDTQTLTAHYFGTEIAALLTAETVMVESESGIGLVLRAVSGAFAEGLDFVSTLRRSRTKREAYKAVKQEPPFRLDQLPGYTTQVVNKCEERMKLADERIKDEIQGAIGSLIASDSKYVTLELQEDGQMVTIRLHVEGIIQTLLAIYASMVVHPSELCKIDLESIPLGEEEERAVAERLRLESEIDKIKRAQKGIRDALNVSDEELQQMLDDLTY